MIDVRVLAKEEAPNGAFITHPVSMETFLRAQRHFSAISTELHKRYERIRVLDYGTGSYGSGRALLQTSLVGTDSKLFLYDESAHVQPSYSEKEIILGTQAFADLETIDWVNVSYVLSHQESASHMVQVLETLRERFPEAVITIVEYALKHRSAIDALEILSRSNAERVERQQFQNDEAFVRMHSRFTTDLLCKTLELSGWDVDDAHNLNNEKSHTLIVGSANGESWL